MIVFPNGDSLTKAAYVWGESLHQLLDNATTRLNLRKHGKFLFTLDGELVSIRNISHIIAVLTDGDDIRLRNEKNLLDNSFEL